MTCNWLQLVNWLGKTVFICENKQLFQVSNSETSQLQQFQNFHFSLFFRVISSFLMKHALFYWIQEHLNACWERFKNINIIYNTKTTEIIPAHKNVCNFIITISTLVRLPKVNNKDTSVIFKKILLSSMIISN